MERVVKEIIRVGRLLFEEGLVSARSGNISSRYRDSILITRTGSHMGNLTAQDIIQLPLKESSVLDTRASVELIVHRRVINLTGKASVVHGHPTYTLLTAFREEAITPIDSEGREILGTVRVIQPSKPSASEELAREVSSVLKGENVVVVRGHGVFSAHRNLLRAYSFLSTLEHSCKILFLKGTG